MEHSYKQVLHLYCLIYKLAQLNLKKNNKLDNILLLQFFAATDDNFWIVHEEIFKANLFKTTFSI